MEDAELLARLDPGRGVRVNGQAQTGDGTFDVVDPATATVVAAVADGAAEHAEAAVDGAAAAAADWAATAPRERSELLRRAFELLHRDTEVLASLIAWENGKSLADARAEVAYAAEFFRWFAEEAVRTEGSYGPAPAGGSRTIVTHRPVGVAALVTPWNFPAAMATRKLGPALAAGCTVVFKPAAETPLTALAVADLLAEAGVPDGVVNVVPTSRPEDVVSTWLADPRVRKLSFTGSTGVGRHLLSRAADRIVSSSMELGGNAPFVVAADADLDVAVASAMVAKFRNGGQACTAANRFYVHADVLDAFTKGFATAIGELVVGPGRDPATHIGPMISDGAVAKVTSLVDDAAATEATVVCRGEVPHGAGSWYPPTLLADVPPDAAILQAEVFGPVAPIVTWTDTEELVARANDTPHGLAAYVCSADLQWALQVAERLDAGMVGINRGVVSDPAAPFGGVNQSGLGREGAREGLRAFQETQYVSVAWS